MPVKPQVEIEGLKDLQRTIRKAKDRELNTAMKGANRSAAEVVKRKGKPRAPRRSGRLAASVTVVTSVKYAAVKAGTASRVPYAGPIHFGWPRRGIRPQPFLDETIRDHFGEIRDTYEEGLRKVAALLTSK